MTIGEIMFWGGSGGAVFFSVMLMILLATAGKKRRKMLEGIEEDYQDTVIEKNDRKGKRK